MEYNIKMVFKEIRCEITNLIQLASREGQRMALLNMSSMKGWQFPDHHSD